MFGVSHTASPLVSVVHAADPYTSIYSIFFVCNNAYDTVRTQVLLQVVYIHRYILTIAVTHALTQSFSQCQSVRLKGGLGYKRRAVVSFRFMYDVVAPGYAAMATPNGLSAAYIYGCIYTYNIYVYIRNTFPHISIYIRL